MHFPAYTLCYRPTYIIMGGTVLIIIQYILISQSLRDQYSLLYRVARYSLYTPRNYMTVQDEEEDNVLVSEIV